jgi:hypothetical protein
MILTDEEHAEWLLDKFKYDGWRSTLNNLKFFGRMLKPIVVVAAWIFWIYAAISWAVPNLLCNKIAKEVSVRNGSHVMARLDGCMDPAHSPCRPCRLTVAPPSAAAWQGSLVFGECLYIDTGGKPYSTNWGSKLFFLLYWSIQNGWMVFFCGYISFVLFGACWQRAQRAAGRSRPNKPGPGLCRACRPRACGKSRRSWESVHVAGHALLPDA